MATVQTPLSGEAEERVAGIASPGESSTPCNLRHSLFHRPLDFTIRNDDLFIYF
jgi:hypothetical protein